MPGPQKWLDWIISGICVTCINYPYFQSRCENVTVYPKWHRMNMVWFWFFLVSHDMIISVLHQLLTYHMYLHFNPYFAIIAFFHGPWTIQGIGPIFRHLYFFVFGKSFAICLGRPIILRRRRSLSWWIRIRQRKNSILYQTTLSQSLGEANMQFWGHDHKQCTHTCY